MVCFGILDQMICESSFDDAGACWWSGSRASGYCSGAQTAERKERDRTPRSTPSPVGRDNDAYRIEAVWPMYAWLGATLSAIAIIVVLLLRTPRPH